jgi:hypothetical protein
MRQDMLDYIGGLSLGGFILSQELPWTDSQTPLWLKNPKRIYVDTPEYIVDRLYSTLDGTDVSNQTTSVRIYFSADAKQLPADYDDLVSDLRLGKDINATEGITRREVEVTTEFEDDLLVTQLEIRFTKLT